MTKESDQVESRARDSYRQDDLPDNLPRLRHRNGEEGGLGEDIGESMSIDGSGGL